MVALRIQGNWRWADPRVTNLTNFVILMVAPINIIKGVGISFITMLVYKRVSPIIKYGSTARRAYQ